MEPVQVVGRALCKALGHPWGRQGEALAECCASVCPLAVTVGPACVRAGFAGKGAQCPHLLSGGDIEMESRSDAVTHDRRKAVWRPQSPAKPDLFTVNLAPPEPRLDGLWCSAGTAPPPPGLPQPHSLPEGFLVPTGGGWRVFLPQGQGWLPLQPDSSWEDHPVRGRRDPARGLCVEVSEGCSRCASPRLPERGVTEMRQACPTFGRPPTSQAPGIPYPPAGSPHAGGQPASRHHPVPTTAGGQNATLRLGPRPGMPPQASREGSGQLEGVCQDQA